MKTHTHTQAGTKLEDLGALLTASHRSCADLYECSCPELEEVVEAAIAAGAKGARLTGGCDILLSPGSGLHLYLQNEKLQFCLRKSTDSVTIYLQPQGIVALHSFARVALAIVQALEDVMVGLHWWWCSCGNCALMMPWVDWNGVAVMIALGSVAVVVAFVVV
eukprot:1161721-Pelagomonas_calceolata.AAC.4